MRDYALFSGDTRMPNASVHMPQTRPDRQYGAEATTKPLGRAIMRKLQRAEAVSTNALLAVFAL
jgi:hypothetical protein